MEKYKSIGIWLYILFQGFSYRGEQDPGNPTASFLFFLLMEMFKLPLKKTNKKAPAPECPFTVSNVQLESLIN